MKTNRPNGEQPACSSDPPQDGAAPDALEKPRKKGNGKDSKQKPLWPTLLICLVGLAILFRPVIMDWYASWNAVSQIETISNAYDPLDDPALVEVRENAIAYNARLGNEPCDESVEVRDYPQQMLYKNIKQMAWIDIPKIEVALPVYHGTANETLAAGVGHLDNTSLPVGGPSSHCVLTGHSGMQGERMFDEVRHLQVGDTFVIHALGEPYAYRIYNIETVWPHEMDSLAIQHGRDLCTLITCTPYGINDHRLLIHAERCEYLPEMEPQLPPKISYWNTRSILFFSMALLVVLVAASLIIRNRLDKRIRDRARAGKVKHKHIGNLAFLMMLSSIIALASVVLGAVEIYDAHSAKDGIERTVEAWNSLSQEQREKQLEQAEIYDEVIAGDTVRMSQMKEPLADYEEQLNYAGGNMGWIQLPKTALSIPVTHGTDDEGLSLRAGHSDQSSLPVGVPSSRPVVSICTGTSPIHAIDAAYMPQPGDEIVIWCAGLNLAYKVESVIPVEAGSSYEDHLGISHDKTALSLIVQAPYQPGSDHFLIDAVSIPYSPDMHASPWQPYINHRTILLLVIFLLSASASILLLNELRRRAAINRKHS